MQHPARRPGTAALLGGSFRKCFDDDDDEVRLVSANFLFWNHQFQFNLLSTNKTICCRKQAAERRWFVLERPRRDTNGGSETEVTVTRGSKLLLLVVLLQLPLPLRW